MKNKYLLLVPAIVISLLSFDANAQAEEERNNQKETRINITVTRDGETQSIDIDPENMNNLKDVLDQVEELENIELSGQGGTIEVIVRSDKKVNDLAYINFSGNSHVFFDEKPHTFLGVVGHTEENGIRLDKVITESGAEDAGLKAGDLILELDGKKPENYKALTDEIRAKKPGDQITLKVDRDGKVQRLKATLGKRENHAIRWTSKELRHIG